MVSALFKACAAGDIDAVNDALASATPVDIEIKDHTGSTPLIEAVRNGHFHVVKALLDKGADPTNASSQGLPETYTADPAILDLLNAARSERPKDPVAYDTNNDSNTYPQYPYYPSINSAPPPDMYYQPPPMQVENGASRHNNLPPPEVASAIPCRYFPACRYGAACLFQHPQGPYFQGPLPPPAQYPSSYEQPYAPTYYPVSPPSFPPPPPPQQGMPEMMPMPPQGPFSPNGAPYGPMSPMMYPHPGQAPIPMSLPPLPPPPQPAPQSPQANFNSSSPPAVPPATFVMPAPQYPPNGTVSYAEPNPKSPQLNPQPELGREGPGGVRRGSARRGSFANRKQAPPCIFFPTGRCKNGSECRFPHVMPPEGTVGHTPFYPTRGGAPRPQRNGFNAIDEKLANLSIQENGRNEPATRGGRGGKANMNQGSKRATLVKQRVPNADEFPVLGGSTTPPARSPNGMMVNGNGHTGPTAAQILQAPRPVRSNSSQAITPARGVTPERVKELKPEPTTLMNGVSSPKIPISFAAVATAGADVSVAA